MPYVMVPVPEEHVEEVMQFVVRAMTRASLEPWDAAAVDQAYREIDEASRSLLAFAARATLEEAPLSDAEAARQIQLTVRETVSIVNELNARAREDSRPPLISPRIVTERLPNGRKTTKRVFEVDADVAELVFAAEQAELAGLSHPLGDEGP
jgi:hypothetical protein